jgi:hypothetical protein
MVIQDDLTKHGAATTEGQNSSGINTLLHGHYDTFEFGIAESHFSRDKV